MILKEKQLSDSLDSKIRAGEEAEKQMAFYLKRAFANDKDCFVLNDLRVIHSGDVAQIDHLIVTQFGLFIIESKSVSSKITVNKHNEWTRTYSDKPEGMPSPILQAKAQGKILRALLMENKDWLLGKALFGSIQKGFINCKIFTYVAISDKGIIDREHDVVELFKADQICDTIVTELDILKKRNRLLSSNPVWEVTLEETKKVADFLLKNHKPPLNNKNISSMLPIHQSVVKADSPNLKTPAKSFVPKVGAICPQCNQLRLIRKSVRRADGTETDFLSCSGYPKECKAIFALVAVVRDTNNQNETITYAQKSNMEECPRCKSGKLVTKVNKAKNTEFVGCSAFPKCRYTR